jgi:prepilin-type N-terminal cleavage/methylation domain-containing protein
MAPYQLLKKKRSGFTLIEMAIVLFIVGIIISIVATVLPSLIRSSKDRSARAQLAKIDNTIKGYTIANHRLPFADSGTDGLEDTDTFVGNLPFRTLGLSSGTDVWGNAIKYGVYGISGGSNNLTDAFADENAFCSAVTSASTTPFTSTIVYTTIADPCSGADATNSGNQAYVVASGGFKDLDGSNGFFDLCNGESTPGFNVPDKIPSTSYDDLTRALAINEILQQNCVGGSPGGGGGGEDTYTNGCTNGTDDDGDGFIDCLDQDCDTDPTCVGGGADVIITTTAIPSGPVNGAYSTTIQASGGTTPYNWTLTSNGGFSDFALNAASGLLTGTLNQCPNTYTISVQVEDSTLPIDGGPKTDAESFSLEVTINLVISRTSGVGTNITWGSPTQQETFETSGGRIGDMNWSLNTGGATGFAVSSTGSNTCAITKVGASAAGTYTFILTATDATCSSNTTNLNLSVTVTAGGTGAPGDISGILDTLEFDTANGLTPSIVHVSGDVYAIAYTGPGSDGWLTTVTIDAAGNIVDTGNDLEFNTASGRTPDILHVSGDVYAIAYTGPGGDGWLTTVTIDAAGNIVDTGNDLEFDTSNGRTPNILHVSGDVYAIAYIGPGSDGWLTTVTIDAAGNLADTGSDLEFETVDGRTPDIAQVSGDVFAIAYAGPGSDGFLKTVEITTAGVITSPVLDTLEFDTVNGTGPDIIQVAGSIFAIAYAGSGSDGFLTTVEFD